MTSTSVITELFQTKAKLVLKVIQVTLQTVREFMRFLTMSGTLTVWGKAMPTTCSRTTPKQSVQTQPKFTLTRTNSRDTLKTK